MKTCKDCMLRIELDDEIESLQQQITEMRTHLDAILCQNSSLKRNNERLGHIAEEIRLTNVQLRRQLADSPTHRFVGIHTNDTYEIPGQPQGRKITVK
jgi:regulator of replication initiation timing